MKFFLCASFLCLGHLSLHAQAPAQGAAEQAAADGKALLQKLFTQNTTQEELLALAKDANKAGVPRQQIIEAKLIWGLRHQEIPFLVKILPEVEILATSFDPALAAALPNVDTAKSFIAYIKAMKAAGAKDDEGFKSNILEAIWLNPQQASVFLQSIEQVRRESKMAALTADLNIPLTNSAGEATTLSDQLGTKKALLLDFWASWCGPCMKLMPRLQEKAKLLSAHGIVVAAVNKDDSTPDATAEAKAEKIRVELNTTIPWLVEPQDRPYTKAFDLESIPRMVLLSPEGKVLFNGHPEDPALWTALKKLDPTIEAH